MLYLAIDQHAKQITVCVRNEVGDTVLRRQVSTRPEKIATFFQQLTEMDSQFMAILEVCGFNDWLIEHLRKWKCREIVLIHPEKPSKKKTNRRDAHKLAELPRPKSSVRRTLESRLSPRVVGAQGDRWGALPGERCGLLIDHGSVPSGLGVAADRSIQTPAS